MAVTQAALEKERLLKRLRDCVHDFMETEGADARDAHEALSTVKAEVNGALKWQTDLSLQFSDEP